MSIITDSQVIIAKIKSGAFDLISAAFNDLIAEHKSVVKSITSMRNLYNGQHDILTKKSTGDRPDKRLVFNYAKKVIWYAENYLLGKPHSYKPTLSPDDANYQKASFLFNKLLEINQNSDEVALMKDHLKYTLIDRRSWELVYIDSEGRIRLMRVPESEFIPVFDPSKTGELQYGIRYWKETCVEGADTAKERTRIELYDREMVYNYIQTDSMGYILDPEKPPYYHYLKEVPFCEFSHPDLTSDLEGIKGLNDDYNEKRCERSKDLSYAADSYLWIHNALFGGNSSQGKSREQIRKEVDDMLQRRVLQTYDGVSIDTATGAPVILQAMVKFVVKELQTEALTDHLKDLRKGIHEVSFTPDIDADKSISNVAETTLKLMFMPADMKADAMETQLRKGVNKRIRLICQLLFLATGIQHDPSWVGVNFRRNRVVNEQELTNNLINSFRGEILDQQTAVEQNPFVEDPELTLERLEQAKKEKLKQLKGEWGSDNHDDYEYEDEE